MPLIYPVLLQFDTFQGVKKGQMGKRAHLLYMFGFLRVNGGKFTLFTFLPHHPNMANVYLKYSYVYM